MDVFLSSNLDYGIRWTRGHAEKLTTTVWSGGEKCRSAGKN